MGQPTRAHTLGPWAISALPYMDARGLERVGEACVMWKSKGAGDVQALVDALAPAVAAEVGRDRDTPPSGKTLRSLTRSLSQLGIQDKKAWKAIVHSAAAQCPDISIYDMVFVLKCVPLLLPLAFSHLRLLFSVWRLVFALQGVLLMAPLRVFVWCCFAPSHASLS